MGNFSDELSSIMRIRKIAVDDIIQSMNISRAAFFKYKNGTRLPAKAEIVEEIADALRLNYNERNSLLESYQIDSIGEYKYRGMQAVERLLTTPIGEFMTNTVVTKNCVFCYSGNMDSGVLYRDERLCCHYRDVIARWRKRAKPFAEKMDLTTSLRSFIAFRSSPDEKYEFIPGICMASIYEENDNLINTNLIIEEGAANRQIYDLVNYSEEFKKGLNAAKERNHFIVPGNTLRFNLNTGYIQELPKKLRFLSTEILCIRCCEDSSRCVIHMISGSLRMTDFRRTIRLMSR